MPTATAPRIRKPRGLGKLKPRHYDYLRHRQAGKTQKEAAALVNIPIATAQRCEKHPDGAKYLADIADNARIAAQYGLTEAVKEVDRAIGFAYEQENPNAIAKLLEHKSKLYGLLIERAEIKTTYIDLKGALQQAKERVLVQLNSGDRGISSPSLPSPAPNLLPNGNTLPTSVSEPIQSDSTAQAEKLTETPQDASCLQKQGPSIDRTEQAGTTNSEQ